MADLQYALNELRRSRKYARTADDDAEQAQEFVADCIADLLEALAETIIELVERKK